MIQLAMAIVAVVIIFTAGVWALGFIASAFDENLGCGCLAMAVVVILGLIVLAFAC